MKAKEKITEVKQAFTLVREKLQVQHYAQIPCKPFCVDVKDEFEALKIIEALSQQHLFLFKQRIIPDYSNAIAVVMWNNEIDEETNEPYGWEDYYNNEEDCDWDSMESKLKGEANE